MLGARDNLSSCGMLQPLIGLAAAAWGKAHQADDLSQVRHIGLQCSMALHFLPGVAAGQKGGNAAASPVSNLHQVAGDMLLIAVHGLGAWPDAKLHACGTDANSC